MGSGVPSRRVGRSGHEVYQSSKPNAEAKNGWSCTSTSPYAFIVWEGETTIFSPGTEGVVSTGNIYGFYSEDAGFATQR